MVHKGYNCTCTIGGRAFKISYKEPKMAKYKKSSSIFSHDPHVPSDHVFCDEEFFLRCPERHTDFILEALNREDSRIKKEKDREFVMQAVGQASRCWAGESGWAFDSDQAILIGESILEYFGEKDA